MDDGTATLSGGLVIPFPLRRADRGQERLDRALAALLRATQEQAAAVATWRIALSELDHAMDGLAGSVRRYQDVLAATAGHVGALGEATRRLEATVGG